MTDSAGAEIADSDSLKPKRPFRRLVAAVLVVFLVWLTWSVGTALLAPDNDSVSARLAELARNHHLGGAVLALEQLRYQLNPPAAGGKPPPGLLAALPPMPSPSGSGQSAPHRPANPAGIRLRRPMRPFARPALPGEGRWRSLVTVHGRPAVQAATWNGAFRLDDANGGFYLDGQTAGSLVDGAASEVFHRNGTMTVGSWNDEVQMAPNVVGVRQNLGLLIDNGAMSPKIDSSPQFNRGATIGAAYYVSGPALGLPREAT